MGLYLVGCAGFLTVFILLKRTAWLGGPYRIPGPLFLVVELGLVSGFAWLAAQRVVRQTLGSFLVVGTVAATAMLTASHAARVMTVAYDCEWSPQAVAQVGRLIQAHSGAQDEVLSGAVVWEFESGRQPFMRITHPLGFLDGMPVETARRIAQRLAERPPGSSCWTATPSRPMAPM